MKPQIFKVGSAEAVVEDQASKTTFRHASFIIFSVLMVALLLALVETSTESLTTLYCHFALLVRNL